MEGSIVGAISRAARRAIEGAAVLALLAAAPAHAADLAATPSTFASVWSAAQGGDRILLASGTYAEFTGGSKPSTVTILPQPGASASMELSFNGASNIRVEGVTMRSLTFIGTTNNITVANSTFTGQAVIRTEEMANANIVLDGNRHPNISVSGCGTCFEGRVQVAGRGPGPSGVTIRNSVLGPGGDADGMQLNADAVQVLNNEFVGIKQISDVHSDSLQLYGATNTVIRGNYFHDYDVAIMAPDGGRNEQITDNAFISNPGGYRPGDPARHATGERCSRTTWSRTPTSTSTPRPENPPGQDNVARDNVMINGRFVTPSAGCTNCTVAYNLFTSSAQASGTNTIVGTPVFAGGSNPTTWAGWALAPGSPGTGNASDGSNRGIRVDPVGPPTSCRRCPGVASCPPRRLKPQKAWSPRTASTRRAGRASRTRQVAGIMHRSAARATRRRRAPAWHSRSTGATRVRIPRSATTGLRRAFTLEAWVRPTARRITWRTVFGATGRLLVRAPLPRLVACRRHVQPVAAARLRRWQDW